jgi:hypothetical protein
MPDREQGLQEGAGGSAGAAILASQEAKAAGVALRADRLPMARWLKGTLPVKSLAGQTPGYGQGRALSCPSPGPMCGSNCRR